MSSQPRVGVVTVTYNSSSVLDDFLRSIAAQEGVDVILYVVDNASHDDSVARVQAADGVTAVVIANDDNLGVAVANNQGIERALLDSCDWVLILNNDTVFAADMIATLVGEADSHGLDLVVPLIEATEPPDTIWYAEGHYRPSQGYRTFHDGTGRPVAEFPETLTRTQYAPTCCLLVRPKVFADVGRMDPVYFVYFDDVDFAVRCAAQGYQYWVTPATRLTHKASSLTGGKASPFTIKWTSRNWPLIARRHSTGLRAASSLAFIQTWMLGRLLLRKDSAAVYRQRQLGFREGVRAASAPHPGYFSDSQQGVAS